MKENKFGLNFLFILSIIILFSISGNAAPVNPVNYGASYNVSIGQTMKYKVTKLDSPSTGINTEADFMLPNGSIFFYNQSLGTIITVIVLNKNTLSSGLPQAYCNISIYDKLQNENVSAITNQSAFLNYAFPNFMNEKSYQTSLVQSFNNGSQSTFINESIKSLTQDGEYFIENLKLNFNPYFITTYERTNWKTGWLSSLEVVITSSNGTILSDFKEQSLNSTNTGFINFLSLTNINTLLLLSILGVLAVFIIIVFSYIRYRRSSNNTKNDSSFRTYLSEKTHFKPKNKKGKEFSTVKPLKTDKSLKMIEEILRESENQQD